MTEKVRTMLGMCLAMRPKFFQTFASDKHVHIHIYIFHRKDYAAQELMKKAWLIIFLNYFVYI